VTRAVVDPSVLVSAFLGNPEAGPGQLITAWRDDRFVGRLPIPLRSGKEAPE
jgi:hypothetical protein